MHDHVDHGSLSTYAVEKVNVPKEKAKARRAQVAHLRTRLETYIASHPDYDLVKMRGSGSVAKHTAIKTSSDTDVAAYVRASAVGGIHVQEAQLLNWLLERCKEVYGKTKDAEDFKLSHHAVGITMHGTGLKIDVAPNAIETLTPERVKGIRDTCDKHGIHVGIHTMSAVNMAEVAPHVRDGVERYLRGHMDACKLLGGEWMVIHAGYHFTSDIKMRMEAGVERIQRLVDYAEKIDLTLLLENMNWEPDDAEVHYLAHNVEETRYYFDRLNSPKLRWAFTANHAHIVEDGVDAFLEAFDITRCDEVRLADCWRNGKEEHLRPGEGDFDFAGLFAKLDKLGFQGHYMNAFGTLQDMIDGREIMARMDKVTA